jgi:hypothetical protein
MGETTFVDYFTKGDGIFVSIHEYARAEEGIEIGFDIGSNLAFAKLTNIKDTTKKRAIVFDHEETFSKYITSDGVEVTVPYIYHSGKLYVEHAGFNRVLGDVLEEESISHIGHYSPLVPIARQILSDSRIVLNRTHPSGRSDNAFPYLNILDTSHGLEASLSNYQNAEAHALMYGSTVPIDARVLEALITLAEEFSGVRITEIAGGSHGIGSKHYYGRAIDISYLGGDPVTIGLYGKVKDLSKRLGYSLILGPGDNAEHKDHIHIEWAEAIAIESG